MRVFYPFLMGAAGAVLVIMAAALFELPVVLRVSEVRDGAAGWVQAFGALLALGVVFMAQRLDHREVRKQREADRRDELERNARASVTTAKFLVASISAFANTQVNLDADGWHRGHVQMHRADIGAALASMKEVDRGNLPNEVAVVASVNLIQAGFSAELLLDAIEKSIEDGRQPAVAPLDLILAGAQTSLLALTTSWKGVGAEQIDSPVGFAGHP